MLASRYRDTGDAFTTQAKIARQPIVQQLSADKRPAVEETLLFVHPTSTFATRSWYVAFDRNVSRAGSQTNSTAAKTAVRKTRKQFKPNCAILRHKVLYSEAVL